MKMESNIKLINFIKIIIYIFIFIVVWELRTIFHNFLMKNL